MKINKHFLQLIGALWILIFHLWMNVSGTQVEQFITKIGYVGVDIFFFVSAYSLSRKEIHYRKFIENRVVNIYLKYLILILIASVYKGWTLSKAIESALFISFFEKGGGSFLWFIPAIMIFYILYPLFLKNRCKAKAIIVFVAWFIITIVLQWGFGYTQIHIFLNRIPVILSGYLFSKYVSDKKGFDKYIYFLCIVTGMALLYFWGFTRKLNMPVKEIYYLLCIPVVIGLAGLSTYIKSSRLFSRISKSTLEIYGLQMIFGTDLVNGLYQRTGNILITNILMVIIMICLSVTMARIYKYMIDFIKNKKQW